MPAHPTSLVSTEILTALGQVLIRTRRGWLGGRRSSSEADDGLAATIGLGASSGSTGATTGGAGPSSSRAGATARSGGEEIVVAAARGSGPVDLAFKDRAAFRPLILSTGARSARFSSGGNGTTLGDGAGSVLGTAAVASERVCVRVRA